jgi:hypothetical protein
MDVAKPSNHASCVSCKGETRSNRLVPKLRLGTQCPKLRFGSRRYGIMADTWEPERLKVGDVIIDMDRSHWGKGTVIADETYKRSPMVGQWLQIDFENRGLVMVSTTERTLRRAEA